MSLLEEAKKKRDRENKVSLTNALKQYLGATTLEPQVQGEDATQLLMAVKEETSSSEDREATSSASSLTLVSGKVVPSAPIARKLKRKFRTVVETDPYL